MSSLRITEKKKGQQLETRTHTATASRAHISLPPLSFSSPCDWLPISSLLLLPPCKRLRSHHQLLRTKMGVEQLEDLFLFLLHNFESPNSFFFLIEALWNLVLCFWNFVPLLEQLGCVLDWTFWSSPGHLTTINNVELFSEVGYFQGEMIDFWKM